MKKLPPYEKYEKLIYHTIHQIHKKTGGDLDEMIGAAGWLFHKACTSYKKDRGKVLSAWIRKVTWDDTMSARRIEIRRGKRREHNIELDTLSTRQKFNFKEFMESLSPDAKRVVDLALAPTNDICLRKDGIPKLNSLLSAAKRHFGWSQKQLNAVIMEVRSLLWK